MHGHRLRDYSNDAHVIENYILDPDFDMLQAGVPAHSRGFFRDLVQEIETSISVPIRSYNSSGGVEHVKERKLRTKKRREDAKENPPVKNQRLWRENPRACIIAPVDNTLTNMETAFVRLGPRLVETKMYYKLDGKPCNTVDILKAAGLQT